MKRTSGSSVKQTDNYPVRLRWADTMTTTFTEVPEELCPLRR